MHVRNFLQNTIMKLREYENSSPSFFKFLGSDTPELRAARRSYANALQDVLTDTLIDCQKHEKSFYLLTEYRGQRQYMLNMMDSFAMHRLVPRLLESIQSAEGQFNTMGRLGKILADIKSTCLGFNKSLEKASPQAKSDFKLAGELIEELGERQEEAKRHQEMGKVRLHHLNESTRNLQKETDLTDEIVKSFEEELDKLGKSLRLGMDFSPMHERVSQIREEIDYHKRRGNKAVALLCFDEP
ncbi:hypothetical protein A0O36_01136 [Piscirickettsiaceae bacterium NZ-RLO1]|nr:hypothetical protein A0O36_01136 [Piscirickettsiaceae bacterium NZ-RLO1]